MAISSTQHVTKKAMEAANKKALTHLTNNFGAVMRWRLHAKVEEGKSGWDDPANEEAIKTAVKKAARNGKWVDVANYAAMLWNFEQMRAEAQAQEPEPQQADGIETGAENVGA